MSTPPPQSRLDHDSPARPPDDLALNLPASRTPIIGRETEMAAIQQTLVGDRYRLVTLTGVGGCGKTRLAIATAAALRSAFSDGVWLVELAGITDEAVIADAIAVALGNHPAVSGSAVESLIVLLRPRSVLLVLDNCEHLIDGCAAIAEHLLDACPSLRILATSREPLQIPGERQQRIGPLALPDPTSSPSLDEVADSPAVQLFVERAQDGTADFRLTAENAHTVAAICIRLDGIPLALELAASRVRLLSVEQILVRLDEMFRLLIGSGRAMPTRQQTLRATLDWSYDLLTPAEQMAFRQFTVFVNGCDIEAAESVVIDTDARDPSDIVGLLTRLVDKSLIGVTRRAPTARYQMLEPVRQYGFQRLTAAGELDATSARHAAHYLRLAEHSATELSGPRQVEWLERLEDERDNLRGALIWATERDEVETLLRLTVALFQFWEVRDHLTEGRGWLERAIQASAPSDSIDVDRLRAKALRCAGRLAHQQRDLDAAESFHSRSLALSQTLSDQLGMASALSELAMEARLRGSLDQSITFAEEALALCRETDDRAATAYALLEAGITWKDRGNPARSRQNLEESLAIYQDLGDVRFIAITRTMLAQTALRAGDPAAAQQHLRDAIAGHHRLSNRWFVIYDLQWLASALVTRGQPRRAALLLGAAYGLANALGEVITPIGGADPDALAAMARATLGDAAFDTAWGEGLALSRDQAVAAALATPSEGEIPAQLSVNPASADARLTRREREVAALLARGYRDRQIADELNISVATVGVHVHRVLAKLGIRSRWQVDAALANTAIDPPSA